MQRQMQEVFRPQLELLEELVNYGSNLIPRAYSDAKTDTADVVVIHNFLKQAVVLMDGIHIAATQGSVINGLILLRSLFEIKLCLEWILKKDTAYRGELFYVWQIRHKRKACLRHIPGTPEYSRFHEAAKAEPALQGISDRLPYSLGELKDQVRKYDEALASEKWKSINGKFESAANGRSKHDWYSPEVGNLREMSKEIGKEAQYVIFFAHYSNLTHGLALEKNIWIGKEGAQSTSIRTIVGADELLMNTFNFSHEVFEKIIRHYRPGELVNLRRKYFEEWRERKLGTPTLNTDENGIVKITTPKVPPLPPEALDTERYLYI